MPIGAVAERHGSAPGLERVHQVRQIDASSRASPSVVISNQSMPELTRSPRRVERAVAHALSQHQPVGVHERVHERGHPCGNDSTRPGAGASPR